MPDQWKWPLSQNGFVGRWTKTRNLILNFLSKKPGHLSAKEIYQALAPLHHQIGLATIYRTLELLTSLGFLNRLVSQDGQNRYEFKKPGLEGHHHHLLCLKCGQIIDTAENIQEEINLILKMEETIRQKYNFLIQEHQTTFYGLCSNCQKIKD